MAAVVVTEFMDEAAVARLSDRHPTLYDPALVDDRPRLEAALAGARALVVRNRTRVDAGLLAAGPGLVCVGRLGVGLDNIDLPAAAARGVEVIPARGANDLAVAEYVVAAALLLVRGAYLATAEVAAGGWPRERLIGGEVSGRVMGLLGYGAIAREVARRARALGMVVIAHDPHLPPSDPGWAGAEAVSLSALLSRADVLSLHVPLTDETRGAIDAAALAAMKPGAVLVNAARGGIVDEAALADALRAGRLGGAALDVFAAEPLTAAAGAQFAGLPNLILTPHVAGVTVESNRRVSELIADAVLDRLERAG